MSASTPLPPNTIMRHAVAPRVVEAHRSVLQADGAVHHHAHRLARGLGVTVRDARRRFLVQAGENFGVLVAGVIDDRLVQAAKAGGRIDRDVLQPDGFQHVRHEVGAGTGDEGFARQFGGAGLAAGFARSPASSAARRSWRRRRPRRRRRQRLSETNGGSVWLHFCLCSSLSLACGALLKFVSSHALPLTPRPSPPMGEGSVERNRIEIRFRILQDDASFRWHAEP